MLSALEYPHRDVLQKCQCTEKSVHRNVRIPFLARHVFLLFSLVCIYSNQKLSLASFRVSVFFLLFFSPLYALDDSGVNERAAKPVDE